jgi:arylsulfatase A-like enzyme
MTRHGAKRLVQIVAVTASFLAVTASVEGPGGEPVAAQQPRTQPNIVLILTDDQRADTLRYMPIVRRLLVRRGIMFTNGYVVNPVCCPSRASILTGTYSHSTGVYTNRRPHGGFFGFDDDSTLATWLQAAGYRTGMFGKYFNGYRHTTYVAPGWDRWFATYGGGAYYDYVAVDDGEVRRFGSDPADYGTSVLRDRAVSFIERTDPATPLFVYWATHAPHEPATPERADMDAFGSLRGWRPASYDERDAADKPGYVQGLPRIDARQAAETDAFRTRQIQSLQAVDRAVGAMVEALANAGRLENTIIVFTSDNGMLWGEHRWHRKSVPYEEAIAVPFVVRYDAMITEPRTDDHLVLNIDLAPTFAAAAAAEAPRTEGRSFLRLLRRDDPRWRSAFLIEHVGEGPSGAPTFCAVHTERYVLVRYQTHEEELYDLARDPSQLDNRAGWPGYRAARHDLRASLRRLCDPPPPGYTV